MIRVDILPDGAIKPLAYDADAVRWPLKAIPGLRWDKQAGAYQGSPHALEVARDVLAKSPDIRLRGEAAASVNHASAPMTGLRDYQQEGARWLVQECMRSGAALLADDMGLGKSVQAIRAAETLACGSMSADRPWVLVLSPAVVATHWVAEVAKWSWQGQSRGAQVASRPARKGTSAWLDVPPADFRVCSYDLFRRRAENPSLQGAAVVIADEAQYLANARARRTTALASYLACQTRRPKLIMLTGTPLTSRPRDLFSLLELMHPSDWGSYWQFTKRYCAGRYVEIPNTEKTSWDTEGISNVPELRQRLKHVMLRRSKSEVGGLPPKIRTLIPVELPAKARKQVEAAAREIDGFKGLARLLGITEAHKLTAACELAASVIEQGGRPLIFTTRRDSAQAIAERLMIPCVTGADAAKDRAAKLADAPAASATMFSLTTGISLTQFDTVIFCGLDWVPSTILQAEARPHRIGQTQTVNVYFLIGLGTVDEMIQSRVIERLDLFDQAIGKAGDGNDLRACLNGGSEEDLIAELIAAVKEESTNGSKA